MPIRILHVVTYMGRGGLETMLMNYYRNIDRSKIQFDFLTHRRERADYDDEIEALGGKIYRLPRLNPFSAKYLKELNAFFLNHPEYKIVHSHLDCMAGIPLKYAKKNGVPVRIAHAHNSNQVKDRKYLLKLLYKKNITKYSNFRFACSEDAGDWMFSGKKYKVLYNAIDASAYQYSPEKEEIIRKELGIAASTLVVGEVARISPQKNHTFLLDVFAEIEKKNADSVLLLVGDGALHEAMKQKAETLGIGDKVIFTGVRSDVPELLQIMDVFVMPSLFEGLPVVMIEAQAAGIPCVISDQVPIECKKTEGLVKSLSLQKCPSEWADEIMLSADIKKRNTYEEIKKSGFDIKENVIRLEKFYMNKYSGVIKNEKN